MAALPRNHDSRLLLAIGLGTTVAMALAFGAPRAQVANAPAAPAGPILRVPHSTAAIELDGEIDDPLWRGELASTGVMPSVDGQPMTDSTVRLAWKGDRLYVLLYAADSDIHATQTANDVPLWTEDSFRIAFTLPGDPRARVVTVSPLGTVTDAFVRGEDVDVSWSSGVKLGHDLDGTPNDPRDDDEEWVIEMAIPLASLGLQGKAGERIGFAARRCDAPKGAAKRCAAWGERGGELELLP
jgi:hypothetical protein